MDYIWIGLKKKNIAEKHCDEGLGVLFFFFFVEKNFDKAAFILLETFLLLSGRILFL